MRKNAVFLCLAMLISSLTGSAFAQEADWTVSKDGGIVTLPTSDLWQLFTEPEPVDDKPMCDKGFKLDDKVETFKCQYESNNLLENFDHEELTYTPVKVENAILTCKVDCPCKYKAKLTDPCDDGSRKRPNNNSGCGGTSASHQYTFKGEVDPRATIDDFKKLRTCLTIAHMIRKTDDAISKKCFSLCEEKIPKDQEYKGQCCAKDAGELEAQPAIDSLE